MANTVGSKLLLGQRRFMFDGKEIEAKMQVHYMSFSAHADAKGITQLIRQCQPSNVVLVHGEDLVMDFLRGRVKDELSKHNIHFLIRFYLVRQKFLVSNQPMAKQSSSKLHMVYLSISNQD